MIRTLVPIGAQPRSAFERSQASAVRATCALVTLRTDSRRFPSRRGQCLTTDRSLLDSLRPEETTMTSSDRPSASGFGDTGPPVSAADHRDSPGILAAMV